MQCSTDVVDAVVSTKNVGERRVVDVVAFSPLPSVVVEELLRPRLLLYAQFKILLLHSAQRFLITRKCDP